MTVNATIKQKILIVDDSEMNRSILADTLEEEYDILEAENGEEAVSILQKHTLDISLVLLDIVMPKMDGFEVLRIMNQKHWIEDIPVIMISAETASDQVDTAYALGVTDFITRPFDALIVHHRVVNTMLLYANQKKLVGMVADQIYDKERRSTMMIDILSHIVEFRNGESGPHILHVRTLTSVLLRQLLRETNRYPLSQSDIAVIATASSIHDIGKIAIDDKILNKPGRLTPEEFAIMKTHTQIGAEMLQNLPAYQDEPLVKTAYEICRWHHERYDGRGYPDGLKGDDIPISAQIVALADVYDALTSDRCYKKAVPHEKAIAMILQGECGVFNPLLMNCLKHVAGSLEKELATAPMRENRYQLRSLTQEMLHRKGLTTSERSLRFMDYERMKYNFFAALTEEIQFEYTVAPPMLTLSSWGAQKLELDEVIMDPLHSDQVARVLGTDVWRGISNALRSTLPDSPVTCYECPLHLRGGIRWYRIVTQALWSDDDPPQYIGAIGKAVDIHDSQMKLRDLEKLAAHDTLTGLLNHTAARNHILRRMAQQPSTNFALVLFDLDHFKQANDTHGHLFGDKVLKYVAETLCQCTCNNDILARVGGDEFLIFLPYDTNIEPVIQRIFQALTSRYEDFPLSVSMGVARTVVVGSDYETLFHSADQALYGAKRAGRGRYLFYDNSMRDMLSVLSPIDSDAEEKGSEKS